MSLINPLDIAVLRAQFAAATPFPFVLIDDFLDAAFARDVAAAYPTFEEARALGFEFGAVNERKKVQITDRALFPEPLQRLSDALSGAPFLAALSEVTGIQKLLADDTFYGAGLHVTGPHGRLDVHVDFNVLQYEPRLYRRLNLLLYFNPGWNDAWGGQIELWDQHVSTCAQRYAPILSRCLIFETSEISFHGVAPLTCPPQEVRRSFAAYYYTLDPPSGERSAIHGTIFRARPHEWLRGRVLMPLEHLARRATAEGTRVRRGVLRRMRRMIPR